MAPRKQNFWPLIQCLVLATGIFAFDLLIPVGIAGAVAYVVVVLAAVTRTDGRYTFGLALACAGLTLLRIFLPTGEEGFNFWQVLTNRLLAVFAIWVTAALGTEWKRSQQALQKARDELEQRVADRTAELSEANENLVNQIAERERAEKTGRELEDRTAVIVEHAVDAIIAIDPDGYVVTWNPRAESLFGWLRHEVLGESLAELIVPEKDRRTDGSNLPPFIEASHISPLDELSEVNALHRDGHEFPVELHVKSVPWGEAHLFIAFAREPEKSERSTAV